MKTKLLVLTLFLAAFTAFGQTVDGIFKKTFPELSGELAISSNTTLNKGKVYAYRREFSKLQKGLDDLQTYGNLKEGSKDILQVFDYKDIKDLDKAGKLDSLKMLLVSTKKEIHNLLKEKEPLGADTLRGIQNYQALKDAVKAKQYDKAYPHWVVLMQDYPVITRNIYLWGLRIVNHKIAKAKTPEEKQKYIDTLFVTYEQFLRYIPKLYKAKDTAVKKSYFIGRYAADLYKYTIKDKKELKDDTSKNYIRQIYALASKSIELGQDKAPYFIFPIAMNMTFLLYQMKELDENKAIENYLLYSDLLQKQYQYYQDLANKETDAKKKEKYQKKANKVKSNMDLVDKIFSSSDISTCENLCKAFGQQYDQKKNDPKFLKNLLSMLAAKNCTDSTLFTTAAVDLYNIEPSADAAARLGMLFASKEDFDNAKKYYLEAVKFDTIDTVKANYYFALAKIERKLGHFSTARDYALKAVQLKPNFGQPYILIALMYAESASSCGKDKFERQAVYWAVVDKLVKAKSVDPSVTAQADELIKKYASSYPDKSDGFMHGAYEGQKYTISGCWINETTTVRYNK